LTNPETEMTGAGAPYAIPATRGWGSLYADGSSEGQPRPDAEQEKRIRQLERALGRG
jgi:hypothetical protein